MARDPHIAGPDDRKAGDTGAAVPAGGSRRERRAERHAEWRPESRAQWRAEWRAAPRRCLQRALALLRPARAERELAREIASHLALLEQEFERRGLSADAARLAARRQFGGVEQAKEQQRDARAFRWIDDGRRDAQQAVRSLCRVPGFTVVAILTLALGIGANTAIFSVVHAVLLQPLPYADADRLVRIIEHVPAGESVSGRPERRSGMAREDFLAWRTQARTLSAMAAYVPASMTLTGRGGAASVPTRLTGARVSAVVFPMLGAVARTGRLFDAADEARGTDTLIVLGDRAWRTHFAADPHIAGRTAMLDGRPHTIVGVMASPFEFPDRQTDFWIPFVASARLPGRVTLVAVIARLADGMSLEAANEEANAIGSQLLGLSTASRMPSRPASAGTPRTTSRNAAAGASAIASAAAPSSAQSNASAIVSAAALRIAQSNAPSKAPEIAPSNSPGIARGHAPTTASGAGHGRAPAVPPPDAPRFELMRVKDQLVAPVRSALLILSAAVGCVLLIACANVANLLLARHAGRQRELAIRGALGASRSRLVRQMLSESLVLGLAGGAAALVVAFAGIHLLKTFTTVDAPWWIAPGEGAILPRAHRIGIDGAVLAFTLGASLLTGLLFGVAPVLRLSRRDPMPLVNEAPAGAVRVGRRTSARLLAGGRARRLLVVVQVATATVLLIGAGLLIGSFVKLSHVPAGYDPANVLTFQVVLPPERALNAQRLAFADALAARLRDAPRVRAAGFTSILPLARARWTLSFAIPGVPPEAMQEPRPQTRYVSQDYLRAMGVRLIDGRWFGDRDAAGTPRAILVNRALVRRYFPDGRPVGAFVTLGTTPWEIVGVVDDVRQGGLETEADPQFFVEFRQLPPAIVGFPDAGGVFFAARTEGDPLAIVADLRALVRQIEPQAALDSVFRMEQLVSSSIARPRFYAVLLGIFAGVAGTLAMVGIYGVLAYSVAQRTREIGIRMALGARRRQVLALVLAQGARLAASGIVIGLAAAALLTRYLSTLLFGLTPLDPSTFAAVAAALALTALLAICVPARRATRVDPLIALRHD